MNAYEPPDLTVSKSQNLIAPAIHASLFKPQHPTQLQSAPLTALTALAVLLFLHADRLDGGAVLILKRNPIDHASAFCVGDAEMPTLGPICGDPELISGDDRISLVQARAAMLSGNLLLLQPKAAHNKNETHAALVVSRESYSNVAFGADFMTISQLRTGSPPNSWESSWAVFNYRDDAHFYYVAFKPNGWELGKLDPAYPGGQRFLATGSNRRSPVGVEQRFDIQVSSATISVLLDGYHLVTFTDTEKPYLDGKIGFYTEDAKVVFDNIEGTVFDNFENHQPQLLRDGAHIGDSWNTVYLGYGTGEVIPINKLK